MKFDKKILIPVGIVMILIVGVFIFTQMQSLSIVVPDELFLNQTNITGNIEDSICHPDQGGNFIIATGITPEESPEQFVEIQTWIIDDVLPFYCLVKDIMECKPYNVFDVTGNGTFETGLICCNPNGVPSQSTIATMENLLEEFNISGCPDCFPGNTKASACTDGSTITTMECTDGVMVATDEVCPVDDGDDGDNETITTEEKCTDSDGTWTDSKCVCKTGYSLTSDICVENTETSDAIPIDEDPDVNITVYVLIGLAVLMMMIGIVVLVIKYGKKR